MEEFIRKIQGSLMLWNEYHKGEPGLWILSRTAENTGVGVRIGPTQTRTVRLSSNSGSVLNPNHHNLLEPLWSCLEYTNSFYFYWPLLCSNKQKGKHLQTIIKSAHFSGCKAIQASVYLVYVTSLATHQTKVQNCYQSLKVSFRTDWSTHFAKRTQRRETSGM